MTANIKLVFEDGEDIFSSLKEFIKEQNIEYALITQGSGAIKDFELVVSAKRGSLEKISDKGRFEVNALSGKIESRKSDYIVSINALVSSSGFTPLTGSLIKAKVCGALELNLRRLDQKKMIQA